MKDPRRLRQAGAVAALLALIAMIVVVASSGGSSRPPATGAAFVVPDDALAYVHLSLDASRPTVTQAEALSRRLPGFAAARDALYARLGAITGLSASTFVTDARRWIGPEAALALLNTPSNRAGTLIVLAVRNRRAAARFLAQTAAAAGRSGGIALFGYPGGADAALLPGFLVVGQPASVRAAIGAHTSPATSLARSPLYDRAAAAEPADRVLDAYLPAVGLTRLFSQRAGVLGALGTLLDPPGMAALTISLSPTSDGARAQVNSVFGAGRARTPEFSPSLPALIPSGAAVLLDVHGLGAVAPRLLAAGAVAGVGGGVGPLLTRLGAALAAEGVEVGRLVALFDQETAVAVTAVQAHPALLIVARARDPEAARVDLASIEPALASLFPPAANGPGGAPVFTGHQVDGVSVHQLQLAPGLELDYAVFRGLIAVSTGTAAIAELIRRAGSLTNDPSYQAVLGGSPGRVGSLVFLDFSQLIRLGVQTGVAHGASFSLLRPFLERIQAIGLRSTSGRNESTSELYFKIT